MEPLGTPTAIEDLLLRMMPRWHTLLHHGGKHAKGRTRRKGFVSAKRRADKRQRKARATHRRYAA